MILAAPPGSVRVNLTDPIGGGKNLALLLHLPAVLRNEKIATRSDEIEKLLDSLVTHIETVVQTRLLNTYATIEDYNAGQPEMTVPYQFLALPDMPSGFTDRAWERLRFIAENGIAAGVYVIGRWWRREPRRRACQNGFLKFTHRLWNSHALYRLLPAALFYGLVLEELREKIQPAVGETKPVEHHCE